MADPVWPTNVPFEPETSSYNEEILNANSTFQPDIGPPTTQRRSTLQATSISAVILLTQTERENFLTFYYTTLQNGSLPFLWDNPVYSTQGRYLFDPETPPSLPAAGFNLYRLTFRAFKVA